MMLIDSHCHFDDAVFDTDRAQTLAKLNEAGIGLIVMPAIGESNFEKVRSISDEYDACCYTLGYHPMFIDDVDDAAMNRLEQAIQTSMHNPKFVGIGEIGLDLFVRTDNFDKQIDVFTKQLKLAKQYHLPVILHVRKAIDLIIKYCREYQLTGGIAHAFNGSEQQAQQLIEMGFKLGFGGAMTFTRARKIRALAKQLDLQHIVLETDAPDMAPAWMDKNTPNSPLSLPKIALEMATIKETSVENVIKETSRNCMQVLPRVADLCTPLEVLH